MTSGSFDETDLESLHFKGVDLEGARSILIDEEEGTFLIRDSSRGGYVICVKENRDVSQYTVNVREMNGQTTFFIREEIPFKNLPALLTFYKRNTFQSTSLKRPVSSDRVIRRTNKEGGERHFNTRSEIPTNHSSLNVNVSRRSAPPDMTKPYDSHSSKGDHPPLLARVVKAREASPYTKHLTLKVNDIIKVTGRSNKEGMGTGELNGVVGEFPLVNVEFIPLANKK